MKIFLQGWLCSLPCSKPSGGMVCGPWRLRSPAISLVPYQLSLPSPHLGLKHFWLLTACLSVCLALGHSFLPFSASSFWSYGCRLPQKGFLVSLPSFLFLWFPSCDFRSTAPESLPCLQMVAGMSHSSVMPARDTQRAVTSLREGTQTIHILRDCIHCHGKSRLVISSSRVFERCAGGRSGPQENDSYHATLTWL